MYRRYTCIQGASDDLEEKGKSRVVEIETFS